MDEINNISPKTVSSNKTERSGGFTVPENYFEVFPSRLQDKLPQSKNTSGNQMVLKVMKPYLAIAASFALVLITWYTVFYFYNNSTKPRQLSAIGFQDTIETADMYGVDEHVLVELIVNETNVTSEPEKADIQSDEVIDYLSSENIDQNAIAEEL